MGTKAKPGRYDCFGKAEDDEPLFVLLARDPLAPILVSLWASLREHEGEHFDKVAEARACAIEMMRWRRAKTMLTSDVYVAVSQEIEGGSNGSGARTQPSE